MGHWFVGTDLNCRRVEGAVQCNFIRPLSGFSNRWMGQSEKLSSDWLTAKIKYSRFQVKYSETCRFEWLVEVGGAWGGPAFALIVMVYSSSTSSSDQKL